MWTKCIGYQSDGQDTGHSLRRNHPRHPRPRTIPVTRSPAARPFIHPRFCSRGCDPVVSFGPPAGRLSDHKTPPLGGPALMCSRLRRLVLFHYPYYLLVVRLRSVFYINFQLIAQDLRVPSSRTSCDVFSIYPIYIPIPIIQFTSRSRCRMLLIISGGGHSVVGQHAFLFGHMIQTKRCRAVLIFLFYEYIEP